MVCDIIKKMSQNSPITRNKLKTDEELMLLYQKGHPEAFNELYRRCSQRVYGYIKKRIFSETLASEVFQEVFMKLHKSKEKYSDQYPFLPWLFTITRNVNIVFYKKNETLVAVHSTTADSLKNIPTSTTDEQFDFSEILSALPEQQRKAIEMRYQKDWTFEKIGESLGTTPANIRQLISRGIKKIREGK
jgi:RNA polymerase sigma factor (sigma-70 family)